MCRYGHHVYKEVSWVALVNGSKTLGMMLLLPRRIITTFALKLSIRGHRDYVLWYCAENDEM